MINSSAWTGWLSQDASVVPQSAEDFALTDAAMLQVNGRYLYLKRVRDLAEIGVAEARLLDALARTGDTVFIAVGDDPSQLRLSYRLPNVDSAVASDGDGLRGLIRQWFAWASAAAA
ncbi:MAG TPA: hypothetical protein VIT43_00645 [Candidatus Dormibacteraeota bacterium]